MVCLSQFEPCFRHQENSAYGFTTKFVSVGINKNKTPILAAQVCWRATVCALSVVLCASGNRTASAWQQALKRELKMGAICGIELWVQRRADTVEWQHV
jgi:hypothetical protein